MTKQEFDNIIKNNLMPTMKPRSFGYYVEETKKTYPDYFSNRAFGLFVGKMLSTEYKKYFDMYFSGKGSELLEHKSKYGKLPPKMASVASSSRFCYLALRDGASALGSDGDVVFEYGCRIDGVPGIPPQLDAFIHDKNIYVEAKCHEIFDSHHILLKEKYWNHIYGKNNQFGFPVRETCGREVFALLEEDFGVDKPSTMFDIKQFLCHLMGIASQKNEESTLVYMFFKPKSEDVETQCKINETFKELKDEIEKIFKSKPIRTFCGRNNIKLKAIVEYATVMEPLTDENMEVLIEL